MRKKEDQSGGWKETRTEMGGGGRVGGVRVGWISEAQLQIWKLIGGRTME